MTMNNMELFLFLKWLKFTCKDKDVQPYCFEPSREKIDPKTKASKQLEREQLK